MNKSELLQIAARRPSMSRLALKLAAGSLCDVQLKVRFKSANLIAKWYGRGLAVGAVSIFLLLAFNLIPWLFIHNQPVVPGDEWFEAVFFGLLGAILGTPVLLAPFIFIKDFANVQNRAMLLTPLVDTNRCESTLSLLKSSSSLPGAWRDLALKERKQLYLFDVAIMEALLHVHFAQTERTKTNASQNYACRKLHGLPVDSNFTTAYQANP